MEAFFCSHGEPARTLEGEGLVSVQQSRSEDLLPNVCSWVISSLLYGTMLYSKLTG